MMMRQNAFSRAHKMLKGGLHCHTTRSDGSGTPEDVIRLHAKNGYDFLALTDHRYYNYKNFAPDTKITILPGMEFDNTFYFDNGFRCFHTVCLGPSKEAGNGYDQDQRLPSGTAKNQYEYQEYLDRIHAKGNLTVYCHPQWSSTPARYFDRLKGDFAMEIWNSGCAYSCDMDTDAAYWDELLGQGKKIFGVATDDGHPMEQHCKGWVMVNAENDVSSILKALSEGAFYSSTGPIIKDFYVDGNIAHIECSPVAKIKLSADCHPSRLISANGNELTSGDFELKDWSGKYKYARITVYTADGKRAWTNPIWLE